MTGVQTCALPIFPYESVKAGPPPVTTEEGMIEEMVQNVLDIHDNGWSSEAERNDTLPMSMDQAFYEMLRKKAPVHDGNNESDQPGSAYKKVRPFPETFETPPGHKEMACTSARQQQRRTIITYRAPFLSRGR